MFNKLIRYDLKNNAIEMEINKEDSKYNPTLIFWGFFSHQQS